MGSTDDWRDIGLDELPQYEPDWVRRILGLEPWDRPERDREKIEQEYNREKYARLLRTFRKSGGSPDELEQELLPPAGEPCAVSRKTELFVTDVASAVEFQRQVIGDELERVLSDGDVVIELGAGFGQNLWHLNERFGSDFSDVTWIGGDFSTNAVTLGRELFEGQDSVRIQPFDYFEGEIAVPADVAGEIIVFTVHSVEQLPTIEPVFDRQRWVDGAGLKRVIHFEPVYELHDEEALLGLLRKRYAEMNDYNRDLLESIQASPVANLQQIRYDVVGINPLNPTSVIHWDHSDRS